MHRAEERAFIMKFYLEGKLNRDTMTIVKSFLQNHLMSQRKNAPERLDFRHTENFQQIIKCLTGLHKFAGI